MPKETNKEEQEKEKSSRSILQIINDNGILSSIVVLKNQKDD